MLRGRTLGCGGGRIPSGEGEEFLQGRVGISSLLSPSLCSSLYLLKGAEHDGNVTLRMHF